MTRFFLSCLNLKGVFPLMLLLLSAMQSQLSAQNCDPQNDSIPPTAVCDEFTSVAIGIDDPNDCYLPDGAGHFSGISLIGAYVFDDGSYDNCPGPLKITVRRQAPYSNFINSLNATNGHPPCDDTSPDFPSEFERAIMEDDTIKFYAGEVGSTQTVVMSVYQLDSNGNIALHNGQPVVTECLVTVEVQDKIKPACIPPSNVTVSCENFDPSLGAFGQPTVIDNACLDTVIHIIDYSLFDTLCNKGTITRTFRAIDCSANSSQCTQRIVVNYDQDYYVRFPNDVIVTSPSGHDYGSPSLFREDCELIGVSYEDQIFTNDPNADYRIERRWTIINWCTYNPNLPVVEVPNPNPNTTPLHPANLPGPIVSVDTAAIPWAPTIVKITPADPGPTNYSTFYDANANGYRYTQLIWVYDIPPAIVTGVVYLDTIANCTYNSGEPLLAGWLVKITGLVTGDVYETLTNSSGVYSQSIPATDTLVEVTLSAPFNFAQNCPSVYTVPAISDQTTEQHIPVYLETECPLLSVDLTTPFLRRCFTNTYTVQACNLGTETVEDVSVDVTLDSYMTFLNSSIPSTPQGNNTFTFELGTLNAGVCTTFQIGFILECAALPGATHCTEAHIFPDTVCNASANWSGADLEVTGFCDGDSVRMTISNIGTGDMSQILDFVVVEDVIMLQSGSFQLNSGESRHIALPATGATWRLEAPEEQYHPWGGVEAKAIEGCGGLNTTGLVTMFPLNTPDPFETTDCQENVGSYDPNDKQAFPRGVGNAHLIRPNTDIEYLIRFQNTGTDTAFTVVVIDTLSAHLEAQHVRPGASSHTYDFAILDGNVLRFRFDNILLPDSNVNEAASHGFVKFRVPQTADNPNGTLIENNAAIYFDFNDPVITNTTFHTVRDHLIVVKTNTPAGAAPLRVYPNPSADVALFELPVASTQARFELTNGFGQVLRNAQFAGSQYRFERGLLPAGLYQYKVTAGTGQVFTGKIMLK